MDQFWMYCIKTFGAARFNRFSGIQTAAKKKRIEAAICKAVTNVVFSWSGL
jgi:hypothetical protein